MSGPFIFIATNRLRDGRLGAEQQRVPELSRFIEANEPRLIAFNEYVNDDHTEVAVVQVHPDAASLEHHMGIIGDRAREAYAQTLEATTRIQVFGTPAGIILRLLEEQAGLGSSAEHLCASLGAGSRAHRKTELKEAIAPCSAAGSHSAWCKQVAVPCDRTTNSTGVAGVVAECGAVIGGTTEVIASAGVNDGFLARFGRGPFGGIQVEAASAPYVQRVTCQAPDPPAQARIGVAARRRDAGARSQILPR